MIKPIEYINYDKISDDVYFLGNNTSLKFNVSLSKKDSDGNRYHFHKEFMYTAPQNIRNIDRLISVKRSFDFYLSIEKSDNKDAFIMIRAQDILFLRMQLQLVINWFNDGTYAVKDNKLIIVNKKESIKIDNLNSNKYLKFDPIIIEWENTKVQQQGIRITLGYDDIYTDINIDRFFGFVYFINSINMYESAQLLINYLQRPQFGYNMIEYENTQSNSNENLLGVSKAKDGRQIKANNIGKSYFDKIEDLEN